MTLFQQAYEMVEIADEEGKTIKAHGLKDWHELTLDEAQDWLIYERDKNSKFFIEGNLIKFNDKTVWISITDPDITGDKE
jgi:hypothetical protein